jgi:hypothetical protein
MRWVRLRDLRRAAHLGCSNHALKSLPVAGLVHPPFVVSGSFDFRSPSSTEDQSLRGAAVSRDCEPKDAPPVLRLLRTVWTVRFSLGRVCKMEAARWMTAGRKGAEWMLSKSG